MREPSDPTPAAGPPERDTRAAAYTERLDRLGGRAWKRWLDVQAPYRWNLRRLRLGHTLDVGCGIGRNLLHLAGEGVGVDHNAESVARARGRGCVAFTPADFRASEHARPGAFDALLFAHVLEHMPAGAARALVAEYLPWLRPGGRVVLITPQEAGFRSDPSHVEFLDDARLASLLGDLGIPCERSLSFPFPRPVGRLFPHNEFVVVGRRPAA